MLVGNVVFISFEVVSLFVVFVNGEPELPENVGPPDDPYFERKGKNGRVEYISARITFDDLDTGTTTNSRVRAYVKEMGGYEGDDAGHLIANRLGGLGTETFNIVPQNANCNRGLWKNSVEAKVYDCVDEGYEATFEVWPQYRGKVNRPYQLKYRWICIVDEKYELHEGTVPNPKPPKKCK